MVVSSPALAEALLDVVGRDHVTDAPAALDIHAVDGVKPRWVVRPGSADEVGRVLALAHAERLAVSPRGTGAAVALGNPPRRLDVVVDLSRLHAVTEYVPEDMVASVEAGLSLAALGQRLAAESQMLALDPIGGSSRSVGGVLATNASGPLRFRYGTARDLTLGVRFVQADGTITWGGAKVVKSVTGYDVPKLLVGSLGTLGVIVGATLRLHPLSSARGSWRIAWKTREAVESFVAALLASSLEPDRVTLLNGEASRALGYSGEGLTLLISIGSVAEAVASQGDAVARLARGHGGHVQEIPGSSWDQIADALTSPVVLRLIGEPKRLVAWLGELEQLASRLDCRVSAVAQAGNGIIQSGLHGEVFGTSLEGNLLRPLREGLGGEGGSLVVERAPSSLKADFDVWGSISSDSLEIMSRLKMEFDGQGTLNPGRFVGGL
jgi:glycolate oxidase FAD binding subunit